MMDTVVKTLASAASAAGDAVSKISNGYELSEKWEKLSTAFVTQGDLLLDAAGEIDLTGTTLTQDAKMTWREEWSFFLEYGSWPHWVVYKQVMMDAAADGWRGVQSLFYWLWLSVQPLLYSFLYILGRSGQFFLSKLGLFAPHLQRLVIAFCRFHLHLGWRQALGEAMLLVTMYSAWRIVRYLSRQNYVARTSRYFRNKISRMKQSIQRTYREIAHVSLLLAMTIPHAAYLGLVLMVKIAYPTWVANLCVSSWAPLFIKFLYPITSTIGVLHHSRDFISDSKTKRKGKVSASAEGRGKKKRKSRRRRSSIGALLQGKALAADRGTDGEDIYTEEEFHFEVTYWINYWLILSTLKGLYLLATKVMVLSTFASNQTVHSIICQVDFFFYFWIFCLPECLLILFPSAGEEERRDWNKSKQWLYECSLQPVLTIPKLFLPVVVPCYEKVSQAVKAEDWKKYVVENCRPTLNLMSMLKLLSEERKEAIVEFLSNINQLVVPSLTLLTPGFITQYAVLYVQFLVPQAHSYRALARERRITERILFLKFWVIQLFVTVIIDWAYSIFWIVPLKTHLAFIAWCLIGTPRMINCIYDELDRELQAFNLLPRVEDDLNVENTHTVRALSLLYASLPKAKDVDRTLEENQIDLTDADENTIKKVGGKGTTGAAQRAKEHDEKQETDSGKKDGDEKEEAIQEQEEPKDVAIGLTGPTTMPSKGSETAGWKENMQNGVLPVSSNIKPLADKVMSKGDEEGSAPASTQIAQGKDVPANKSED